MEEGEVGNAEKEDIEDGEITDDSRDDQHQPPKEQEEKEDLDLIEIPEEFQNEEKKQEGKDPIQEDFVKNDAESPIQKVNLFDQGPQNQSSTLTSSVKPEVKFSVDTLMKELESCTQFRLFIHNMNEETMMKLRMIEQDFASKVNNDIGLIFSN